jgi:flagellar biosynthesis protein FliP
MTQTEMHVLAMRIMVILSLLVALLEVMTMRTSITLAATLIATALAMPSTTPPRPVGGTA